MTSLRKGTYERWRNFSCYCEESKSRYLFLVNRHWKGIEHLLRHVRITNITINNHVLSLHGVKTNSGSPISRKLRQMRYCYGLNYSSSKNWIIAVRLERKMRTWICGFLLYLVFLNIITSLSSNHGERFSTQSIQEFAIHYSSYSRGIINFRDGSAWAPLF